MKMIRNLATALLAASLVALPVIPAQAASQLLCAPTAQGGSKRIVNPNTTTAYTLNGRGCSLIGQADIGWFQSQGFTQPGFLQSTVALGQTAAFTVTIPAGTYIRDIIAQETSGATVTGGLKIGTTAGGTDIVSVMGLTSLGLVIANEVSLSKRIFSATAPQTIFVGAVSSFNTAAVNVTVVYGYF